MRDNIESLEFKRYMDTEILADKKLNIFMSKIKKINQNKKVFTKI